MFDLNFSRRSIVAVLVQVTMMLAVEASAPTEVYGAFDFQDCWAATPLQLNAANLVLAGDGGDVLQLEVLSPGVLILETDETDYFPRRVSVELISKDCEPLRGEHVTFIDRSLSRPVLRVNQPGVYYLRVNVGEATLGDSYHLIAGFSEAVPIHQRLMAMKDVEEWQDDDETPETGSPGLGSSSQWGDSLFKDVEEWQDDDETPGTGSPGAGSSSQWVSSLFKDIEEWRDDEYLSGEATVACGPSTGGFGVARLSFDESGILAAHFAGAEFRAVLERLSPVRSVGQQLGPSRETMAAVKPGTYLMRWAVDEADPGTCEPRFSFYPTCDLRDGDDHGDSQACATELTLDSGVAGEIGADSADLDWFSIVLTRHARINVLVSSDTKIDVDLLDAEGRSVVGHDVPWQEWGSGIEAELCPGRYFVKVDGGGFSGGQFSLLTSTQPI